MTELYYKCQQNKKENKKTTNPKNIVPVLTIRG